MKRIISMVVFVAIIMLLIPTVYASSIIAEGKCEGNLNDDLSWELNSEGVLRIYGEGVLRAGDVTPSWNDYVDQIETLIIDEGITSMWGLYDTEYTNLKKIYLPKSYEFFEAYYCPFKRCPSVETIVVDEENTEICSIDNVLYEKPKHEESTHYYGKMIYYPPQKKDKSYTIPDKYINCINFSAFACGNQYLEEINLLDNTLLENGGVNAAKLSNLQRISIGDNHIRYSTEDDVIYDLAKKTVVFYPPNKKNNFFSFPNTIKDVGPGAFMDCNNLEAIILPSSVETIEFQAFQNCKSLNSIYLPSSVKTIGMHAFSGCSNLIIHFEDSEEEWNNKLNSGEVTVEKYNFTYNEDDFFNSNCYPLFFDAQGGTSAFSVKLAEKDKDYGNLPTVQRNGYSFSGWYTAPAGGEKIESSSLNNSKEAQTLYAQWSVDVSVNDYSYSFSNSNASFGYAKDYTIPLTTYQIIYGNNVRAEEMYLRKTYVDIANQVKRPWDGSCAGMTATSELLVDSTNGINPVNFNTTATAPKDLAVKDNYVDLNIDLTTFIEALHVAQYTQLFKNDRSETRVITSDIEAGRNNLNEFHDQIKSETEAGRPVLLAMMPGNGLGHAILGYAVNDNADGTSEILVYDNRWPMKELSLVLEKDRSGNYTTWSYDMDADGKEAYGVWGTSQPNSNISFVYYDTILNIWNTRGKLGESNNTNMLSINSDDFSLYSSTGKELVRVENGELIKTSNDIDLMERELSLREEDEPENIIVAPIAVYRVVNNDDSIEQLEVSATNAELGASVNTTADAVVVAVQDSVNYNSITVCADTDDTYTVSLKSTLNDEYNEIIASGTGTEEDATISMIEGSLDVEDCALSSLIIDGEDQGPFIIKATSNAGGTITPNGDSQVLKGENLTYSINPDNGYAISDVIVDGKSIGAVSNYEFKDIVKSHTIEAKFKKSNLYGDSNGDGQVDASDLTTLARHLAKIEIIKDTDQFENCDVNHDGQVNAEDLTKLARFIAKIISSL